MREDPIVYEDWQIGKASNTFLRPLKLVEGGLNLLLILSLVDIVISSRVFSLIPIIAVLGLGVLLVDYFGDNLLETILAKLVNVTVLFVITGLAYFQSTQDINPFIGLILGTVFFWKISLIPIFVPLRKVSGEIILPKNEKVEVRLLQAYKNLSTTSYGMNLDSIFEGRKALIRKNFPFTLIAFVFSLSMGTILGLGDSLQIYLIRFLMQVFLIIMSLYLSYLLIVWYTAREDTSLSGLIFSRMKRWVKRRFSRKKKPNTF